MVLSGRTRGVSPLAPPLIPQSKRVPDSNPSQNKILCAGGVGVGVIVLVNVGVLVIVGVNVGVGVLVGVEVYQVPVGVGVGVEIQFIKIVNR